MHLEDSKLKTIKKIIQSEDIFIPVSIFKKNNSYLGSITKYLKDELGLKNAEIARILNKDYKSTWQAYQKTK